MKTCPLTILVAVAIVMYFLLNTFFPTQKKLILEKRLFLTIYLLLLVR